ncbi:Mediator of RNA polymerase II transcription subunit 16 [Golovinomyces cichoracearum]|uniref:Mediator of RNA polymerase II transcription subunit 16 n=1 Tax=Golovinomyces cichoracearum TaxID=62708 RepID=A0A420IE46_9PEZI|nr:Mediator of RNA polymerase II transcription subunit 16 [Golovinomyces cichoracearum]
MPLMMEGGMDIDDLFGDVSGLSLSTRPSIREISQRVDELRTGGCCQQIAWSKCGSIASISPNGYTLEIRFLRCHHETGTWTLSEPSIPSFTSTQDGGPLRHLSWSPTGCDLAVIDSAGRVTIFSIFSSLNKFNVSRSCHIDSADDLQTVVGSYWLPLAPYPLGRPIFLHGPAVKDDRGYRYETSQAPLLGPCHPNHSKSAFVFVTTNGLLKLLWPQNNSKWCDIHSELESILSSDDLITHAAICPDKNQGPHGLLLIAFATASKQLRTVHALIDWNIQKVERGLAAQIQLNPTIKTKHLAVTSWGPDAQPDSLNSAYLDSSMFELSYLEFLPPAFDTNTKLVPATILAVKSYLPNSRSQYNYEVQSTFERWEVRDKQLILNPAFEQLGGLQNNAASQPGSITILKKLENITVNKIVVGLETMNQGRIIFLAYSDGSVEYRDRSQFLETFNDNDLSRIWHLSQIGYTYTEDEPCRFFVSIDQDFSNIALSPTQSSIIYLKNNGKPIWKQLEYSLGQIGKNMDEPIRAATIAALSLSCGTAVMRNSNYDDLLAFASRHLTHNFSYEWLMELSRILKLHVDYSDDSHHDQLVRNTTIQLCLSIQSSLGFKGESNARVFSGKNAWIVLQLRNIVVLVTMAANLVVPGISTNEKVSPLEDPEIINFLTGSVRWTLDLIAWIVDTLLSLPHSLPSNIDLTKVDNLSLSDLLAHLHSTNNIALHLLLASTTRGFLTATNRRLQHLDLIAKKTILISTSAVTSSTALSPSLRTAYRQIANLLSNSIIRLETVDKLLTCISQNVKNAYANYTPSLNGAGPAEKARNILESKLLFGGPFPDAFKPVIVEIFKKGGLLEILREEIDEGRLFFDDFSMLEIDEEEANLKKMKQMNMTMDCFKKLWLKKPCAKIAGNDTSCAVNDKFEDLGTRVSEKQQELKWRRCTRCASVSEDAVIQRQSLQWLVMQQRRCFCSGYWCTISPGEVAI